MHNHIRECEGRGYYHRMSQFLKPALLLLLEQAPAHGYTLLRRMFEFGLESLTPTVVYRALRGMESQGWVKSTRDEEKSQGPPRRVYALTDSGRKVLDCCATQLRNTQQMITYFFALHDELTPDVDLASVHLKLLNKEIKMKIVIPVTGDNLDSPTSSVFGRSNTFIFVDPDTLEFDVLSNPAISASGGAGVQAAQTVLQKGVQAVLAPRLGPNAFQVIKASGIPAYQIQGGTAREAVEAFKAEKLILLTTPGGGHVGLGGGHRRMG